MQRHEYQTPPPKGSFSHPGRVSNFETTFCVNWDSANRQEDWGRQSSCFRLLGRELHVPKGQKLEKSYFVELGLETIPPGGHHTVRALTHRALDTVTDTDTETTHMGVHSYAYLVFQLCRLEGSTSNNTVVPHANLS